MCCMCNLVFKYVFFFFNRCSGDVDDYWWRRDDGCIVERRVCYGTRNIATSSPRGVRARGPAEHQLLVSAATSRPSFSAVRPLLAIYDVLRSTRPSTLSGVAGYDATSSQSSNHHDQVFMTSVPRTTCYQPWCSLSLPPAAAAERNLFT